MGENKHHISDTPDNVTPPFQRRIAFIDIETTGLDPDVHEILQIGIVLVEQPNLNIISEHEFKIKPQHIATATPAALAINGYTSEAWEESMMLVEAMELFRGIIGDAIPCMHKVDFDSSFLKCALKDTGVVSDGQDAFGYYLLDTLSMAWLHLYDDVPRYRSSVVAAHLGIPPEPDPHTAINGARLTYEIYKKLMSLRMR